MNLVYEPTWDKALPDIDRRKIEQKFQSLVRLGETDKQLSFTPLWQAINHRSDLLVTVLINNYSEKEFSFKNITLQYVEDDDVKATNTFTLKRVIVPPDSSMPWTFIFPETTFTEKSIRLGGYLVYK
ncbi:SLAP domain-containing protein [Oceanobacillus sp. J11TS1]|uniref:SLAP domain-containing protein n=1 Tax=Oceanobacillus sp. J11TS1 TaxID=2807191 RepID=UPI001B0ADED2|nr:SLAP domain-containing protein [Oceanobacillus sp. J11TS1]GIO22908.1 hypothetical protein J11TS1_14890 [Oceanobacillus sp. J11TS1]